MSRLFICPALVPLQWHTAVYLTHWYSVEVIKTNTVATFFFNNVYVRSTLRQRREKQREV